MKVPERNARPIEEAPLQGELNVPAVFHRTKRVSRVFAFVAVLIGYCISFCLLLIGAICLTDAEIFPIGVVLALFGAGILGACVKSSIALSRGALIQVLTFERDRVAWGYLGKEHEVHVSQIESFNWTVDLDGDLTLSLRTKAGKRFTFAHLYNLVHRKERPTLLAYLKATYPDIDLSVSEA